jgi:hypothetical protein
VLRPVHGEELVSTGRQKRDASSYKLLPVQLGRKTEDFRICVSS